MHSQICYRTSVLCQCGQRPNVAGVSNSFPGRGSRISSACFLSLISRIRDAANSNLHRGTTQPQLGAGPPCQLSVSSSRSSEGTGREIPNFLILAISVVLFSPSRAAAPPDPPITQPVSCNACRIKARCESLNVLGAGTGGSESFSDTTNGFASTPLLERITARSTRFWSSRTFPGQEYDVNAARISCGM